MSTVVTTPLVMDAQPSESLPLTSGIKRRKSDGKRLHSPPKRQRLDHHNMENDEADLEEIENELTNVSAKVSEHRDKEDSLPNADNDHQDEDDLHFLRGYTALARHFAAACSDEELRGLVKAPSSQSPKLRFLMQQLEMVSHSLEYLECVKPNRIRPPDEDRLSRQSFTLRTFRNCLSEDEGLKNNDQGALQRMKEEQGTNWAEIVSQMIDYHSAKLIEDMIRVFKRLLSSEKLIADIPPIQAPRSVLEERAGSGQQTGEKHADAERTPHETALDGRLEAMGLEAKTNENRSDADGRLDKKGLSEVDLEILAMARMAARDLWQYPDQGQVNSEVPATVEGDQAEPPVQSLPPSLQSATATQSPESAVPLGNRDMPTRLAQSDKFPTSKAKGLSLQEQYAQARIQAANRDRQQRAALAHSSSSRRVWTKEEEDALMHGLDLVGGPFWAKILENYGENGMVNTVLSGRSQVQLKDKARNLKLLFLKSAQPVPACLQEVTGELKR